MKQITLTLLGIFLVVCGYAQTNINDLEYIDGFWRKKGETIAYNGRVVEYYANGKIKGEGEFKDGLVHGLRTVY